MIPLTIPVIYALPCLTSSTTPATRVLSEWARFYYDGLMSSTSPANRVDLTDEMITKNIKFQPRDPGAYSWEPWPTGYDSDVLKELAKNNAAVNPSVARETELSWPIISLKEVIRVW
jgi:hypothetical protein